MAGRPTTTDSIIYTLSDRDGVKYVGQTKNPRKRFGQHFSYAQNCKNTEVSQWLRKLIASGDKPVCSIIEYTQQPNEREIFWIKEYRGRGCGLLNMTDGGKDYKYLHKQKKAKPWGNTLSPTQKLLKTLQETKRMYMRYNNQTMIDYWDQKYIRAVEIIKKHGHNKLNHSLWIKHEQTT